MSIVNFPRGSVNFDDLPKRHRAAAAQKILGELVALNPVQNKTVSVDTIAITTKISSLFDAARFGLMPVSRFKRGKRKKSQTKRWHLEFEHITGAILKITYTQKFGHWLTVETSLPLFARGSNLRRLNYAERIEAIESLSAVVSERLGFPVNLFNGNFSRIDLFQDIRFGTFENLILAIAAFKQLKISNRRLSSFDFTSSVGWKSTGKKKTTHKVIAYDKTAERLAHGEKIPVGILRIESQYFDNDYYRGYSVRNLLSDEMIRQLYFAHLWQ